MMTKQTNIHLLQTATTINDATKSRAEHTERTADRCQQEHRRHRQFNNPCDVASDKYRFHLLSLIGVLFSAVLFQP
ncbi:MAG: hypothetical protein V4603_11155 [Pseudomonadota bacterium]